MKVITVLRSEPNATRKAHAIKSRFLRDGYPEAIIHERSDRYLVATQPISKLTEAERVRRSGR